MHSDGVCTGMAQLHECAKGMCLPGGGGLHRDGVCTGLTRLHECAKGLSLPGDGVCMGMSFARGQHSCVGV